MLTLDTPLTLYHGSNVLVEKPDLTRCRPRKDFGRGFYLTSSRMQAESFARTIARRANRLHPNATQGFGVLSRFKYLPNKDLHIRVFSTADSEWLRCVAAHRGAKALNTLLEEFQTYDIIAGKVANDQTNATLLAYIGGLYGEVGSPLADEMCIRLLIPSRLDDQACFRTPRSLDCLSFEGSERVWL
jgi:hypothetical protein